MLVGIDASRATVLRRTGTEWYSVRLIEALLSLGTAHRFRLYFNRPPPSGLYDGGAVERRCIPFPRLWTHIRLGIEVAQHPPDVLFVPSHVLPFYTRPPAVVTVHDLGYLHFPQAHPRRQRWYLDWSTRHNARLARVVVADSKATQRDLVSYYGVPPEKIVVAYPGLASPMAPINDEKSILNVKRHYNIQGDYFLHLGTLQPRKNLARLVRAFSYLQDLGVSSSLQLVLAGKKGWFHEQLFNLVRQLGLEGRVIFAGYVDETHKATLLSGALACVFPSLYEGFGFPALEAQACDVPLICANTSSLPEVAGEGALLVDPLDVEGLALAMARVVKDETLRDDLVARGQRNQARFSWPACARAVMRALERALL